MFSNGGIMRGCTRTIFDLAPKLGYSILIAIHPLWMTSEENVAPGRDSLAIISPGQSLIRSLLY